jgi:hypothetical protein
LIVLLARISSISFDFEVSLPVALEIIISTYKSLLCKYTLFSLFFLGIQQLYPKEFFCCYGTIKKPLNNEYLGVSC